MVCSIHVLFMIGVSDTFLEGFGSIVGRVLGRCLNHFWNIVGRMLRGC